jgi:asparagine synthetase B (glutamine-hydrolysing)
LYAAAGQAAFDAEIVAWCARTGLLSDFFGKINPEPYRDAVFSDQSWIPESRMALHDLFETAKRALPEMSKLEQLRILRFEYRVSDCSLYRYNWWGRTNGILVRFPYLDADLRNFRAQMPSQSSNQYGKSDVRRHAERYLPKDMADTPRFRHTIPIRYWFRGSLRDFLCDQLAPSRIRSSGVFSNNTVQKYVKEHVRGKTDHEWKLWTILTVLAWQDLASRRGW